MNTVLLIFPLLLPIIFVILVILIMICSLYLPWSLLWQGDCAGFNTTLTISIDIMNPTIFIIRTRSIVLISLIWDYWPWWRGFLCHLQLPSSLQLSFSSSLSVSDCIWYIYLLRIIYKCQGCELSVEDFVKLTERSILINKEIFFLASALWSTHLCHIF